MTTPNLSFSEMSGSQNQKEVTFNGALYDLDALVMLTVLDRDLTAPPGGESDGDRYLVDSTATGAWAGHDGDIAYYNGGGWTFYTPAEGWLAWVADEDDLIVFDGSTWSSTGGGGGGASQLSDLSDVNTSTATDKNVLVADGTDWESRALAAGDIQSGTFANGRISEGSVTQHRDAVVKAAVNTQSGTSYTLALTDAGDIVEMNNGSANTVTIPTNASVAFPVGTVITVTQYGAGTTTISGDTGVTVNGVSTGSEAISAQYAGASLYKRGTDEWIVQGALS